MNIFLVPWTWARHISVALITGTAALLTWWFLMMLELVVFPTIGMGWRPPTDGAVFLGFTAAAIAGTSILVETSLRRQSALYRFGLPPLTGFMALLFAVIPYVLIQLIIPYIAAKGRTDLVSDPGFTSLHYRWLQWAAAGFASGTAPCIVRIALERKLWFVFDHLGGALAASLLGVTVWHVLGYLGIGFLGIAPDLYYAPMLGVFTWGVFHGLLVWGIPPDLYAGWVRVLSAHRFGHRIPVDRVDARPAERFIGHFPRGLDMYLPAERGVAELHVSFTSNGKGGYAVRGLSQQHTNVVRFLEKVNLAYDPRRPAPLETEMHPEDIVKLGPANAQTEVEFILLPKEER
jgi:hypothetical protein